MTDADEGETFIMLSAFPQKCPPERRLACAELLTRINLGLTIGYFEMDLDSGRIYFKTLLPFVDGSADGALLQSAVVNNLRCMVTFLPVALAVIYGNRSPKAALAKAMAQRKSASPKALKRSRSAVKNASQRRFL